MTRSEPPKRLGGPWGGPTPSSVSSRRSSPLDLYIGVVVVVVVVVVGSSVVLGIRSGKTGGGIHSREGS